MKNFMSNLKKKADSMGIRALCRLEKSKAILTDKTAEGYIDTAVKILIAVVLGALTGLIEPLGAVIGAIVVSSSTMLLPWGLGFAAGAMLFVDMAHIAGLVAAGLHPSPVPYADVVTTTTHKTLRGPRGGLILCRDAEFGKQFNKAIFPGIQGGPLMHVIAAKAVAFKEALSDEFKVYQQQVLDNAKALADELVKKGFRIVSGGTDNHLMLVDLRSKNITGKEAQFLLDEIGITANRNTIPFEPLSPFVTSGIRLGTPALTTRGLKEEDIREVADIIADVIENREDSAVIETAKAKVQAICKKFPLYEA